MSVLFTNFHWWKDGSLRNMRVAGDGLVTYMGPDEPFADDEVDLEGGWVLPGFVDCHCHIMPAGFDLLRLDLTPFSDPESLLRAVRERANQMPEGAWLLATHYDQNRFDNAAHLTHAEIDAWVSDRPVILRHSSGHACVVNTAAMQAAGIGKDTPDPRGGELLRNERGEPTGALLENAMDLAYRAVPRATKEEMAEAIFAAAESMSRFGITSAADMMTGHQGLEDELWAYRAAAERGAPLRMRLYVQWSEIFKNKVSRQEIEAMIAPVQESRLALRGVKLFADGAIGAGTAAMHEEYLTGGKGKLIYPEEELRRRISVADEAGYAVAVHSIGDRSTDLVMDCFQDTADPSRHRIEHVMALSDEQISRMEAIGCRATLQPEFLAHFAHAYRKQLGEDRYRRLKRLRSLDAAGVPLGLSSDRPIVPGDPWAGIRIAADHGDESISIDRGIVLYTSGAAEMDDDEAQFGRLNIRQLADFQVYDKDPREPDVVLKSVWLAGEQA